MGALTAVHTSTVVLGSPALAADTAIVTTPPVSDDQGQRLIVLKGWLAFTVGTTGTGAILRIRQGAGVTGTSVAITGTMQVTAGNLVSFSILGQDSPGEVAGQQYTLCLQVVGATAASAVGSAFLEVSVLS